MRVVARLLVRLALGLLVIVPKHKELKSLDVRNTRQPSQKHKKHSVSGCVSETLETHSICKSSLKFQKHKKHSVSGSVSETLETFLSSRVLSLAEV